MGEYEVEAAGPFGLAGVEVVGASGEDGYVGDGVGSQYRYCCQLGNVVESPVDGYLFVGADDVLVGYYVPVGPPEWVADERAGAAAMG